LCNSSMDSSEDLELDVEIARLQRLRAAGKRQQVLDLKDEILRLGGDPEAGRTPVQATGVDASGSRPDPVSSREPAPKSASREPAPKSASSSSSSSSRNSSPSSSPPMGPSSRQAADPAFSEKWADALAKEYLELIGANENNRPGLVWAPLENGHFDRHEAAMFGRRWKAARDATLGVSSPVDPLPKGWTALVCERSGDLYYYDEDTKRSTFTRPTVIVIPRSRRQGRMGPYTSVGAKVDTWAKQEQEHSNAQWRNSAAREVSPAPWKAEESWEAEEPSSSTGRWGPKRRKRASMRAASPPQGDAQKRMEICKFQDKRSGCIRGQFCNYRHTELWKKCFHFQKEKYCSWEDRCPMRHPGVNDWMVRDLAVAHTAVTTPSPSPSPPRERIWDAAESDKEAAEAPAKVDCPPAPASSPVPTKEETTAPARKSRCTAAKAKPPSFGLPPGPAPTTPRAVLNPTFNGFATNLMMHSDLAKEAHQLAKAMKEQKPTPKGNGPM
jgi:hypothetical protein